MMNLISKALWYFNHGLISIPLTVMVAILEMIHDFIHFLIRQCLWAITMVDYGQTPTEFYRQQTGEQKYSHDEILQKLKDAGVEVDGNKILVSSENEKHVELMLKLGVISQREVDRMKDLAEKLKKRHEVQPEGEGAKKED